MIKIVDATPWQLHKCLALETKPNARTIGLVRLMSYLVARQAALNPWEAMSLSINRRN